jgi:hypothetical protein
LGREPRGGALLKRLPIPRVRELAGLSGAADIPGAPEA